MAVIKLFDSKGVKTLIIQGNAAEQPYDDEEEVIEDPVDDSVEDE